jgi:hypothetical protein
MALTTGQINLYYPTGNPLVSSTGVSVGATIDSGAPVNFSRTGVFATGHSNLAGGTTHVRYAKLFFRHDGTTGDIVKDPQVYITNTTYSDQLTLSPDPYYLGIHTSTTLTGMSSGRETLPGSLNAQHFSGYTVTTPLNFSSLSRGQITMNSGDYVGFWAKLSIPPGLPSSAENTFSIVFRGDISS